MKITKTAKGIAAGTSLAAFMALGVPAVSHAQGLVSEKLDAAQMADKKKDEKKKDEKKKDEKKDEHKDEKGGEKSCGGEKGCGGQK